MLKTIRRNLTCTALAFGLAALIVAVGPFTSLTVAEVLTAGATFAVLSIVYTVATHEAK